MLIPAYTRHIVVIYSITCGYTKKGEMNSPSSRKKLKKVAQSLPAASSGAPSISHVVAVSLKGE
jgi:hypothetical protein